tara:strand:+ start:392 stop:532 length:141 start_codon:yes stop_codon:yes gene_type:complete
MVPSQWQEICQNLLAQNFSFVLMTNLIWITMVKETLMGNVLPRLVK